MLYFTTLFDYLYLSRGLIMYESLLRHCPDFHLYIFAFDDITFSILKRMNPENVSVISLSEFESPALLEVKKTRTKAEYCWTCTPSTIAYVLNNFNVTHCTYLDSDLYFYSDPSVLVNEMVRNGKSVLITEHRFSPIARLYEEKRGGRFCVQFMTFTNDGESLKVLTRWKGQCIDWCYSRYEDGKFGDQKYLEEWPGRYTNIHILRHPGGGLAPWNIGQYSIHDQGGVLTGVVRKSGERFMPVFYHFQYVKQIAPSVFDIGWYLIPEEIKRIFYLQYLEKIIETDAMLRASYKLEEKYTVSRKDSMKNILKASIKKIAGYNIMRIG